MAATIYTFRGISFRRIAEPGFEPWWGITAEYTADPVLRGSQQYVDIGGVTFPPLTIRAWFSSLADRTAFKLFTALPPSTLSNDRGRTAQAILVQTTEVDYLAGAYVMDCVFEKTA